MAAGEAGGGGRLPHAVSNVENSVESSAIPLHDLAAGLIIFPWFYKIGVVVYLNDCISLFPFILDLPLLDVV